MIKYFFISLLVLFCSKVASAQVTYQYDAAGNRIKRFSGPDLLPRISISPTLSHGISVIEISVAVLNVGGAPTNGGNITVRVRKNSILSGFTWNANATSTVNGTSVQNSLYSPSEDDNYYLFNTTAVIPKNSQRRLLFSLTLTPGSTNGTFPLGVSIPSGGSGGEINLLNNLDSGIIDYFSN